MRTSGKIITYTRTDESRLPHPSQSGAKRARFYRLEVWPDLFRRALLVRLWGHLDTPGYRRLDPHPDPGAAINALARLLRAKRRRGYQERMA